MHNIVARFNGDTDFAPGPDSNAVSQVVTQATSTMSLTSSANPSRFGQAVTFRATVGSATGGGPDRHGAVLRRRQPGRLGRRQRCGAGDLHDQLARGGDLHGDRDLRWRRELHDEQRNARRRPDGEQGRDDGDAKRSTSEAGAPLTLTATMLAVALGGGMPTGSVTFLIDGINRGTVNLVNGVAALFLPNGLSQGSHTIVVQYAGSGSHNASNTTFFFNFGGRTG